MADERFKSDVTKGLRAAPYMPASGIADSRHFPEIKRACLAIPHHFDVEHGAYFEWQF